MHKYLVTIMTSQKTVTKTHNNLHCILQNTAQFTPNIIKFCYTLSKPIVET